uniref:Putative ribonuclease H-like domain-containing protein n=1 Tax=Tanacetum cinerariifolium TaxID=118510 RepID=A0A6L2MFL7_TANCI|nr:putative ribonuclease H-like domain-containing protein [Tanacetum cinerariifolium]
MYTGLSKLCMDFIKHQGPAWCDEFEVLMKGEFEISAIGELTFFLGLQVKQLPDGIFISQDKDSPFQLEAYSDSDYVGSHGDRKSTTSGCQILGKSLISLQCKKQTVVATSSTKAEYVAAASCCGQASNTAGSTTIPVGSSMDTAVQAAVVAPSSTIPAADKGKAHIDTDDSLPANLLKQSLLDSKRSWHRRLKLKELLHLLIKLLGDDVNEENMNERLGMLLMRKIQELAEQSRVKPMNKTLQRDFMWDFVKNQSALVYNQGWTIKQVPTGVFAASSIAAAVSVSAAPSIPVDESVSAAPSVPANTEVHADESRLDDPQTTSEHVSTEPTVNETTLSSLRTHRKHLAKKWVTPIVDIADDALIKFDSTSDSDDDPLPYAPYAGWEWFLLHWGDLHVLFQSLDDEDDHDFWRNQDSWRIRSWRLYPRAQVHVLETVDGWVIYMFVDVSYPLSAATLQRMLKHGLEVPKLLVGRDLTMAEQLFIFIKAALLNAQSAV